MTDSEMKKVLDSLAIEDLSETELAISMLVAVAMANRQEVEKATTVVSER